MASKFLMCAVDHFDVGYELNPWVNTRRAVNGQLARAQWQILYKILTDQLGADVDLIEPVNGLPNMVFTGNAGLVSGQVFIPSHFRQRERQPETAFFESWFRERGYEIASLPKAYFFEGEGDAFIMGDVLISGYRDPTDAHAHALVADILRCQRHSFKLVDDRFYRLDTCFLPLGATTAVYYPNAFQDSAASALKKVLKKHIFLRLEEALNLVCHSIVVGKSLITPMACKPTNEMLKLLGYQVHPLDLSEFAKLGAGIKSLVLTLARE